MLISGIALTYKASNRRLSSLALEDGPKRYCMIIGPFEIYFDASKTFDQSSVSAILKRALEDAANCVLRECGASLALLFLCFPAPDRVVSQVYDTSDEIKCTN